MKRSQTQIMVECAMLIAFATVLGFIPAYEMPQGGSVTVGGMAPLVIASLRHGKRWGLRTGLTYGIIQSILPRGIRNVLYAATLPAQLGVILLDYIVAYTLIGFACVFAAWFKNRTAGACAGAAVTGFLRYICHFISGILIWGGWAPEGTPVWIHSVTYNAAYMIPETIITVVTVGAVVKLFEKKLFAAPV